MFAAGHLGAPGPRPQARKLFIVAGEVSGDMQAAHLAAALLRDDPALELIGIGGPRMANAGVRVLQDSTTWGVIGYVDPLLHLRAYVRRLATVEAAVRSARGDLLLLVDFAAFNLRLAERLHGQLPIAYYFPPMVSVRRGNRARKVARLGIRVLPTLRREADAYRAAGADVRFVGHPAVDLVPADLAQDAARRALGVSTGGDVVGLLPGSRAQEIRAHLPVMLEAAALIRERRPAVAFLLPAASPDLTPMIKPAVARSRVPVRVVDDVYAAMAASTVLITATGTATIEAAIFGVPMVAVYRLNWLSWLIAQRIVTVPFAALPNILAGREIIPELLQARLTPHAVADVALTLLADASRAAEVRRELLAVAGELGGPGAIRRAAAAIWEMLRGASGGNMK